jgi:hypothetical protein
MNKPAVKVTKLIKGVKVGDSVPKQCLGNVGYEIEARLIENGYSINIGHGLDMPDMGLEVKTRKTDAQSANTVGSMTLDDIKSTTYNQSNVCAKIQRQYRVEYDNQISQITSEKVYDFTDPFIQRKIELGYESARKKIIAGVKSDYINGGEGIGYFEKKRGVGDTTSYDFRISGPRMKKLETLANNSKQFNNLFD